MCAKQSWTRQRSGWKTSRKGRVGSGGGGAVSRLSAVPNKAVACLHHPPGSSMAPELAVTLAVKLSRLCESPSDTVQGYKAHCMDF